ncbi:MAG: FKBP-type peptidyl-prolyl cis-trans isomerase [Lysobacteraceae bacterium]|jgi:peptidylprolyl isomerase|nr:MAG: FKBP-type peptidyl-prolyl cis-trans isomerase [Xanthomonadaceae bacterium]
MKLRLLAATLAAMSLVAGSAFAQTTPAPNKNDLSYALGYDLGRNLVESGEAVDVNTVIKALQEGYAKKEPTVPVAQLRTAVETMQKRQGEKAKAAFDKAAVENKAKSDQFLAQNKAKAGVQTLPSGVQYRVIEAGSGAKPTASSTVQLEFTGPFPLGQRPQQARPAQQIPSVKVSEVEMQGMRDALTQMQSGAKWEITLPSEKAYGNDPRTGFPPNLAVVFEVKLVSIK